MDFKRILVAGALVVGVLWLYQLWLQQTYPEYASGTTQAPTQSSADGEGKVGEGQAEGSSSPQARMPEPEDTDGVPSVSSSSPQARDTAAMGAAGERPAIGTQLVSPLLRVGISPQGGDIKQVQLPRFREEMRDDSDPVSVVGEASKGRLVAMESGWVRTSGPSSDHKATYQGPQETFHVEPGAEPQQVSYVHRGEGVRFRKTYILHPDSYVVDVRFEVINEGNAPWSGDLFARVRNRGEASGSLLLYDFAGPVVFAGNEMRTFSLGDLQDGGFQKDDSQGWAGVMDRYFLAALLPEGGQSNQIFVQAQGESAFSGFVTAFPQVAPGESASVGVSYFLGPKEQGLLKEQGRHLHRAVDYGILSFLSIPLYQVLEFFHGLVGNYGFAIILLTLVIKLIFFPLFSVSYRAMAKMRKVQPELQRIREQHSDDKQKLNEEMMRLYREEKVNPLGGCLPILIQIPVFIALYWVLLESVELRHEPFMLWINDLTSKDPYYVLPILMGGSMVVQQLLNPSPLDPVQQKIMLALPVVFTVFFMQFPAGLVLYWFSNNLFSIAQQWWIMRKVG